MIGGPCIGSWQLIQPPWSSQRWGLASLWLAVCVSVRGTWHLVLAQSANPHALSASASTILSGLLCGACQPQHLKRLTQMLGWHEAPLPQYLCRTQEGLLPHKRACPLCSRPSRPCPLVTRLPSAPGHQPVAGESCTPRSPVFCTTAADQQLVESQPACLASSRNPRPFFEGTHSALQPRQLLPEAQHWHLAACPAGVAATGAAAHPFSSMRIARPASHMIASLPCSRMSHAAAAQALPRHRQLGPACHGHLHASLCKTCQSTSVHRPAASGSCSRCPSACNWCLPHMYTCLTCQTETLLLCPAAMAAAAAAQAAAQAQHQRPMLNSPYETEYAHQVSPIRVQVTHQCFSPEVWLH